MAAARYWRMVRVVPRATQGALTLGAIEFYNGPTQVVGTLSSPATAISPGVYAQVDAVAPGFLLQWDMGTSQQVTEVRFAANPFFEVTLQRSDDAVVWVTEQLLSLLPTGSVNVPLGLDLYSDKVQLLLHAELLVDSSLYARALSALGGAAVSTAQSKFGSGSLQCGAGWGFSASLPSMPGDFAVELWAYFDATGSYDTLINVGGGYPGGLLVRCDGPSNLAFWAPGGSHSQGGWAHATGQWHHIALTRQDGLIQLFADGQLVVSATNAGVIPAGELRIGQSIHATSEVLTGYIDEVCVTVGAARYTLPFTPPVAPTALAPIDVHADKVVLLLEGEAMVDTSPKARTIAVEGDTSISTVLKKFGNSSLYFDGAGDVLNVPHDDDFEFGSGDFTLELWINPDNVTGTKVLLDRGDYSNYTPWLLAQDGEGVSLSCTNAAYDGWAVLLSSGSVLTAGVWSHVAAVRSGSTFKLFHDGVEVASATYAGALGSKVMPVRIGRTHNGFYQYAGYMDDVRITKGAARYLSNFTPASASSSGAGFYTATPLEIRTSFATTERIVAFAPPSFRTESVEPIELNIEDGGQHRVVGTVKEKGTPANTPLRRKVQLYNQRTSRLVGETWSAASDGSYEFNWVRGDVTYFVVSFDYTGTYRAVIADNLQATL